MTAGELQKVLEHIAPDTPVKIRINNGPDHKLVFIKDPKDLAVRFQTPDAKPVLTIDV